MAGFDFNETFAPVARVPSLRAVIAMAVKRGWEVVKGDINTAFLAADMDAEMFIRLPKGFSDDPSLTLSEDPPGKVRQAYKGIPGIKQGSHLWNDKAHKVVTKQKFERVADDYCVYIHADITLILVLWVDDMFFFFPGDITPQAKAVIANIKQELDLRICDDVGSPTYDILGVTLTYDRARRRATLDQAKAVDKLLKYAGMEDASPEVTPLAKNSIFSKRDCPSSPVDIDTYREEAKRYRSLTASIIYLSQWTRPDLAFAASKLSKFMHNPGPAHVKFLKRTLRYLAGTRSRCLLYDFSRPPPRAGVYGYYDAAHADDIDTRRSTMAYLFFYEGCPISWKSKLHSYVTTSTNHSEYCASAKAAREAKWLFKLFSSLKHRDAVTPIDLFSDSTGAISMNYNPVHHESNKHCDLADHFAREQVERGIITISHVPTAEMLADLLTKPLAPEQFLRLLKQFMAEKPLQLPAQVQGGV